MLKRLKVLKNIIFLHLSIWKDSKSIVWDSSCSIVLIAQNSRIDFRSPRSSIWIKDLLLHINPRILRLGIVLHFFSFHENVHTKILTSEWRAKHQWHGSKW